MRDFQLIYPMFALVLLTMVVLVTLFRRRVRAVQHWGKVAMGYFGIYQGPGQSPNKAPKRGTAFLQSVRGAHAVLCRVPCRDGDARYRHRWPWCWPGSGVGARVVHAAIHLGGNRISQRLRAYFIGWLALAALWIQVVAHVALKTNSGTVEIGLLMWYVGPDGIVAGLAGCRRDDPDRQRARLHIDRRRQDAAALQRAGVR